MIRSRVASFIVALNPTMSVESKIDLQKINNIDKIKIEDKCNLSLINVILPLILLIRSNVLLFLLLYRINVSK